MSSGLRQPEDGLEPVSSGTEDPGDDPNSSQARRPRAFVASSSVTGDARVCYLQPPVVVP
ncbi:hypothetical protein ACFOWE_31005 [Planomonospora corallina]|uniref:Uncharacterized protein n=1 Tax=Planomonospora corallina TaxID=1806052 RepID=A0ABV8IET2_9ACTN